MAKMPKYNFEQGRGGKKFDPPRKGDARGSNKSWTDRLKLPKGNK